MEVFKPRVFIFPILIYGHRGSGKSYRANTIAHALGGQTLYLNASEEKGQDCINSIIQFIQTKNLNGSHTQKIIVINDIDHMTTYSQTTIASILDQFGCDFKLIMTANYLNKIAGQLLSRTVKVFHPKKSVTELRTIYSDLTDEVIRNYDGDIRVCRVRELSAVISTDTFFNFIQRYRLNYDKLLFEFADYIIRFTPDDIAKLTRFYRIFYRFKQTGDMAMFLRAINDIIDVKFIENASVDIKFDEKLPKKCAIVSGAGQ